MSGRRRAFTIIELLVIVAIIAVLVALLLPQLSRARAMAARTRCLANVHELLEGLHVYLAESQGAFPQAVEWGWESQIRRYNVDPTHPENPATPGWGYDTGAGLYPAYVTARNAFYCPVELAAQGLSAENAWNLPPVDGIAHRSSYWLYFSSGLYNRTNYPANPGLRTVSLIPGDPGGATWESRATDVTAVTCWPELNPASVLAYQGNRNRDFKHGRSGLVTGFLDGHSEYLPRNQMIYDQRPTVTVPSLLYAVHRPYIGQPANPAAGAYPLVP